jgi:Cys/Met metabolism PLP-dependent enzyme
MDLEPHAVATTFPNGNAPPSKEKVSMELTTGNEEDQKNGNIDKDENPENGKKVKKLTLSTTTNVPFDNSYKDPLRQFHPSTAVIIAGYRSDLSEEAIKAPLFRSSTFQFKNAQQGELFFQRAYNLPGNDHMKPGLVYSRLNNPNTGTYENKETTVVFLYFCSNVKFPPMLDFHLNKNPSMIKISCGMSLSIYFS